MIATGTDIKPLECCCSCAPVKSRVLFEQMLGRGTRVISPTDLQAVTPDARAQDALRHRGCGGRGGAGEGRHADAGAQAHRCRSTSCWKRWRWARATTTRSRSLAGRLARLERTLTRRTIVLDIEVAERRAHACATWPTRCWTRLTPTSARGGAGRNGRTRRPTPEQVEQAAGRSWSTQAVAPFDEPAVAATC